MLTYICILLFHDEKECTILRVLWCIRPWNLPFCFCTDDTMEVKVFLKLNLTSNFARDFLSNYSQSCVFSKQIHCLSKEGSLLKWQHRLQLGHQLALTLKPIFFMDQFPSLASWGLPGGLLNYLNITKPPGSPQGSPPEPMEGNRFMKKLLTWKNLALKNCVKKKVYEKPKAIS